MVVRKGARDRSAESKVEAISRQGLEKEAVSRVVEGRKESSKVVIRRKEGPIGLALHT